MLAVAAEGDAGKEKCLRQALDGNWRLVRFATLECLEAVSNNDCRVYPERGG